MPPTKTLNKPLANITTRSKANKKFAICDENVNPNKAADPTQMRAKRKADCSPSNDKVAKRSAMATINNKYHTANNKLVTDPKGVKIMGPVKVQAKVLQTVKTVAKAKQNENIPPPAPAVKKVTTRSTVKQAAQCPGHTVLKAKDTNKQNVALPVAPNTKKRLSVEFEKSDESLYSTALETSNDSTYFSAKKTTTRSSRGTAVCSTNNADRKSLGNVSLVAQELLTKLNLGNHEVPEGIVDYDKENWDDIFQVSHYAMDIFNYYKEKETEFPISDYMDRQVCLSKNMRALLVDWMVEIQESFELNHETLYLGVKLVDMYLDRVTVSKDTLQLVGAAAMFVASKFDERIPPLIDDFLYICDGAYNRREMIRMEISLVKIIGFNLGIPISYRFLRRYARCAKITMNVLTLARYILEFSLMEYETVTLRDSLLASAALYLALRMKQISGWTPTLEFYTGYKLRDLTNTVLLLNRVISKPARKEIMTVRNKYSHKIFFEVAKTPLLNDEELF